MKLPGCTRYMRITTFSLNEVMIAYCVRCSIQCIKWKISDLVKTSTVTNSVADPGCLSRVLIFTHPGSRIPDPKTATTKKDRGEKNNLLSYCTFYVATNFTKLKIIVVLKC